MDRTLTPALSQRERETGGWGKSRRGANGKNGITSVVATKIRFVPRRVRVYACRRETPGTRPFLPGFPSRVCGWRRSGTNWGRAGCKIGEKQASVPSPVSRGTVPVRNAAVLLVADMGSAARQEAAPARR